MFDEMWKEIEDMGGEIFDICPNTGMQLFSNQEPFSEEEIDAMFEHFCR